MRVIIKTILIISMIHHCESMRGLNMNKYVKNLNKAIYNVCNKEAFIKTKNEDIYNCLRFNSSIKCANMTNFTEYNKLRFICIDRNNSEIGSGIFITIIIWLILLLSCRN